MNEFGDRLSELRKFHNMTQKMLAEKLNISVTTLSNYENGHKRPSDDVKALMAKYLMFHLITCLA